MQTATLTRLIRGNDGKAHLPGEILTIRSAVTQQLGEDRAILMVRFADGSLGAVFVTEIETPLPTAALRNPSTPAGSTSLSGFFA